MEYVRLNECGCCGLTNGPLQAWNLVRSGFLPLFVPRRHSNAQIEDQLFAQSLKQMASQNAEGITIIEPVLATDDDLLVFHSEQYVERVKELSKTGEGDLNVYDTPAFKGVYEASLFPVGSTLFGLQSILDGKFDHFFNPVGGLHHASADEARGFCVFNDSSIAITKAVNDYKLRSVGTSTSTPTTETEFTTSSNPTHGLLWATSTRTVTSCTQAPDTKEKLARLSDWAPN